MHPTYLHWNLHHSDIPTWILILRIIILRLDKLQGIMGLFIPISFREAFIPKPSFFQIQVSHNSVDKSSFTTSKDRSRESTGSHLCFPWAHRSLSLPSLDMSLSALHHSYLLLGQSVKSGIKHLTPHSFLLWPVMC